MTNDVFISYSRENREVAERIAGDLARSGLRVSYDKELLPGEAWGARLEQQLRSAKYVLVLLSPSYVRSPSGRRELEAAALFEARGDARIVPVLIQDTEIPTFLRAKLYADLRADYETGFALIRQALTPKPEVEEVSRSRCFGKTLEIAQILLSLLSSAVAAVSVHLAVNALADLRVLGVVGILVAGLTALIALLSSLRPVRRSKPIQVVTQGIERAYIEALDQSHLNPTGTWEASRA